MGIYLKVGNDVFGRICCCTHRIGGILLPIGLLHDVGVKVGDVYLFSFPDFLFLCLTPAGYLSFDPFLQHRLCFL